MTAEIRKLEPLNSPILPVDEDLIARLEHLLQLAKEGDIQGMAYITIQSVGAGTYSLAGDGWVGGGACNNLHVMIGTLTCLQARMVESQTCVCVD